MGVNMPEVGDLVHKSAFARPYPGFGLDVRVDWIVHERNPFTGRPSATALVHGTIERVKRVSGQHSYGLPEVGFSVTYRWTEPITEVRRA